MNLPVSGAIEIDGTEQAQAQFHFHTPSEEKFDGKNYPLVAHLVHKSAQGKLAVVAVVAVLFEADRESATLAPGTSALALGGLLLDAQELLGRRVDVVTEASLHPALRAQVLADAVPL